MATRTPGLAAIRRAARVKKQPRRANLSVTKLSRSLVITIDTPGWPLKPGQAREIVASTRRALKATAKKHGFRA